MSLESRIVPCLDVKDGCRATPAAAQPRGRAKRQLNDGAAL